MRICAKPISKYAVTLALSTLLVACGGGGSDEEPTEGGGGGGGASTNAETTLTGDSGTADNPCRTGRGEDPDSSTSIWSDNCWIERDVDGATGAQINQDFANSNYSRAIQRIVWCDDLVDGITLDDWDDGSFGPNTEMAVIDYQTAHGLLVDGVVGTDTWREMEENSIVYLETRTNSVELLDIDVYSIASTLPACTDLEAFYQQIDTVGDLDGWSMAGDELGIEAEQTFSNGF
ncbi:MAG: peptidoglycan-binding domain-containing protein [Granulosicoccaceae bacterium]